MSLGGSACLINNIKKNKMLLIAAIYPMAAPRTPWLLLVSEEKLELVHMTKKAQVSKSNAEMGGGGSQNKAMTNCRSGECKKIQA